MKLKKLIIKNDLFNISLRLKKIDKNYFIVFNKPVNRYEVYYRKNLNFYFSFCLGNKLNAYALKKAEETCIKNAKKIFREINLNNLKLQEKENMQRKEKYLDKFNELLNYANSKSSDCSF